MASMKYPWWKWCDGRTHGVSRGDEFTAKTESFRNYLYNEATRRGKKVRIREPLTDVVVFQFYDKRKFD